MSRRLKPQQPQIDLSLLCSLVFILLSTLGLLGGFVIAIAQRFAGK